jgi:hypothetical protein
MSVVSSFPVPNSRISFKRTADCPEIPTTDGLQRVLTVDSEALSFNLAESERNAIDRNQSNISTVC